MKCFFLLSVVASITVSAIDVPQPNVRVRDLKDDVDSNSNSEKQLFRAMAMQQLQQFQNTYSQLVQKEEERRKDSGSSVDEQECVPCYDSNDIDTDVDHHHHRGLLQQQQQRRELWQLFPKLRSRLQGTVQNVTSIETNTSNVVHDEPSSSEFMTLLLRSDDTATSRFFGGNSTLGGIFDSLGSNPILLFGGLIVSLVIVLPLAILEVISTTTSTPIFCILGFATSPLFGDCRRRRRQQLELNDAVSSIFNSTFIDKYFPNGQERLPTRTTDTTADLRELINIGLQPATYKLLNQVTLNSFMTEIASHEETRPYVSTALIAFTPLVLLDDLATRTNTPAKCVISDDDCPGGNRRHLESLSTMDQCEINYFRCQMKTTYLILG